MFQSSLEFDTALSGELIRPDGSARNLGVLAADHISKPITYWRTLWEKLRKEVPFVAGMSFAAFMVWLAPSQAESAVVTTAGITYLMTLFVSSTNPLLNAKFHDCGTGTTAAAIGDTALQTAAGTARVSGTNTNPTGITMQSVATISFTSTLAITEWGLFTASTSTTLWDHKIFSAVNVVNLDSIAFTYTLTGTAG